MKNLKALALLTLIVSGYPLIAEEKPSKEETIARRMRNMRGLTIRSGQVYDVETTMPLAHQPSAYLAAIDELNHLRNINPTLFREYVQFIRNYSGNFLYAAVNPIPLPSNMRNQLRSYRAIPNNVINAQNSNLILHIIDNDNLSA